MAIAGGLRWFWYARARREGRSLFERCAAFRTAEIPARVRGLLALVGAVLDNSARAAVPAAEAEQALSGGVDEFGQDEALNYQATALGRAGRVDESVALSNKRSRRLAPRARPAYRVGSEYGGVLVRRGPRR